MTENFQLRKTIFGSKSYIQRCALRDRMYIYKFYKNNNNFLTPAYSTSKFSYLLIFVKESGNVPIARLSGYQKAENKYEERLKVRQMIIDNFFQKFLQSRTTKSNSRKRHCSVLFLRFKDPVLDHGNSFETLYVKIFLLYHGY